MPKISSEFVSEDFKKADAYSVYRKLHSRTLGNQLTTKIQLPRRECDILFGYLSNRIPNLDDFERKVASDMITHIINADYDVGVYGKIFLIKAFVMNKCERYGFSYPKFVKFVSFEGKANDNVGGYYDSIRDGICFNLNLLSKYDFRKSDYVDDSKDEWKGISNMLLFLMFASHETEHYFQWSKLANGELNPSALSALKQTAFNAEIYLPSDANGNIVNEYKKNYNYKEVETFANERGFRDVSYFLVKHSYDDCDMLDTMWQKWFDYGLKSAIASQKEWSNGSYHSKIIEDYNIRNLIEIVASHPSYVERYPQLKVFFYGRGNGQLYGKLRDIDTLVKDYSRLEDEYNGTQKSRESVEDKKTVYREFFYYLLNQDDFILPPGSKKEYSLLLKDLITEDLYSCARVVDYHFGTPIEKHKILSIKAGRIKKFMGYLSECDLFDEYSSTITSAHREFFKVYETAKLMYPDVASNVELASTVAKMGETSGISKVEARNPEGRKSAINI